MSSGNMAVSDVIGGYRDVILTLTDAGSGSQPSNSMLSISLPAEHQLVWNNNDGNRSKSEVKYFGSAGTGFAPRGPTDGGAATQWIFAYGTWATGDAAERVTITAYSGLASTTWQTTLTNTPTGFGGTAVIPYSADITGTIGGGANMTAITGIDYSFDMTPSLSGGKNYSFDTLDYGTVPEPVTMCGMLLGITGLVRYVRKRVA